ncbi:2-dehydro-3-deoxygalactonokinase [Sphingomonas sp. URHD0057]|uniref:2-dehydro-3-deoxygalactonokinase n=1 Tax=Sphingomonas sp. URHD0057 TaxID=1380389 RepID=UPI001E64A1F4|nr:2-dehydro-3-deoxygalactonokinase [Sphingomonas sp. URHD0057]
MDGFIAVDWGTTNRRGYRIDSSGECPGEFEDGKGILSVPSGGFPAAVAEIRERLGDHPLLLAGMIGSNRGWVEAPYVPCPGGIDELAAALVWPGEREAIVPGMSYVGQGRADVMRGEEVQLLGGVASGLVDPEGFVCHPGTHNKWALLRHGKLQTFGTVMTGELFNLLKEHSILCDLLQGPVEVNDAFRQGVRDAMERELLPASLFGIRAAVLLGQKPKEDAPSYTSGLLIGTDVRIGLTWPLTAQIAVMGRPELTRLYAAAIAESGRETIELDGERCFLAGIGEIAKRIS